MKTVPQTCILKLQIQFPTDPRRQTDLWSCSAGLQRCSRRSGREQRFAGLGSRRLHKYRLADVCGAQPRAASCAAWLKQGVGLSRGRLKASAERDAEGSEKPLSTYHAAADVHREQMECAGDFSYLFTGRVFLIQHIKLPITRTRKRSKPTASDTVSTSEPVSVSTNACSTSQRRARSSRKPNVMSVVSKGLLSPSTVRPGSANKSAVI